MKVISGITNGFIFSRKRRSPTVTWSCSTAHYTTLFHHKYGMVVEKQAINKTTNTLNYNTLTLTCFLKLLPFMVNKDVYKAPMPNRVRLRS